MTKSMFLIFITLSILSPMISYLNFSPIFTAWVLCFGVIITLALCGFIAYKNDKIVKYSK